MPWKVSGVVEKRKQFIEEWLSEEWTMTELCLRHEITRQAGYNTIARYQREGWRGLEEQSRAPRRHPNQTPVKIEQQIVERRQAHMRWGPRKLKAVLEREWPEVNWPAASTMGELLRREGLVVARKKRRRVDPYSAPFAAADAPNRVWCGDFKGWRRTQDGTRIDPLTISDACSRYLLRCQAVEKTDTVRVQAIFEAAFREYGLPEAIRTDNGAPFASCAIAGLSRLAIWWMKLGIRPERIQPAHPEQNGRHERMHLMLQQETMSPMAAHRRAQQRRFDLFRHQYNQQRPHQALQMHTPASATRSRHVRSPCGYASPSIPAPCWYVASRQADSLSGKLTMCFSARPSWANALDWQPSMIAGTRFILHSFLWGASIAVPGRFMGNSAFTSVPVPTCDLTNSLPPRNRTRSCMLSNPSPSEGMPTLNPSPSSRTFIVKRLPFFWSRNCMCFALPCRTALVNASWATLNRQRLTSVGSSLTSSAWNSTTTLC